MAGSVWPILRYYQNIAWRTKETQAAPQSCNWSLSHDSKPGPPKFEIGVPNHLTVQCTGRSLEFIAL